MWTKAFLGLAWISVFALTWLLILGVVEPGWLSLGGWAFFLVVAMAATAAEAER